MSGSDAEDARNARLGQALRENLRRRKAQARGRRTELDASRAEASTDEQDRDGTAGRDPRD